MRVMCDRGTVIIGGKERHKDWVRSHGSWVGKSYVI